MSHSSKFRTTRRAALVQMALAWLAAAAWPEDPRFGIDVENAAVAVAVTDRRGQSITGLTAADFRLYENGEIREILSVYDATEPASVVVLLDASRSVRSIRQGLLLAFRSFLFTLADGNQVGVLGFDNFIETVSPFEMLNNRVRGDLFARAASMDLDGQTAMFDALEAAAGMLRHAAFAKRAVLLFGDGGDNASRVKRDEIFALYRTNAIVIHTVALSNPNNPDQNLGLLRRLAKESGGYFGVASKARDLKEDFDRVAEELRASYVLSFVPAHLEGAAGTKLRIELAGRDPRRYRLKYRQVLARNPRR
ncbi:MAG: VWA domain-containing protein [Bryobacterales bacterium]|nr:VWA domain-containing protein [Bryobacterales bacterium]